MNKQEILEVLNRVYDPDYVSRSIVDMGLVTADDIIMKNLAFWNGACAYRQTGE